MNILKMFALSLIAAAMPATAQRGATPLPPTGRWLYETDTGLPQAVVNVRASIPNVYYSLRLYCHRTNPVWMQVQFDPLVHGIVFLRRPTSRDALPAPTAAYERVAELGEQSVGRLVTVITYRDGRETGRQVVDRERLLNMWATRQIVNSLSEADRIVVAAASGEISFSAQGSGAAIRSLMSDCRIWE